MATSQKDLSKLLDQKREAYATLLNTLSHIRRDSTSKQAPGNQEPPDRMMVSTRLTVSRKESSTENDFVNAFNALQAQLDDPSISQEKRAELTRKTDNLVTQCIDKCTQVMNAIDTIINYANDVTSFTKEKAQTALNHLYKVRSWKCAAGELFKGLGELLIKIVEALGLKKPVECVEEVEDRVEKGRQVTKTVREQTKEVPQEEASRRGYSTAKIADRFFQAVEENKKQSKSPSPGRNGDSGTV